MKIQVMAIRDRALGAFMRPWFAQALGQAVRIFQDELENAQGDLHKHPDDYDLYHLGDWDDQTATFTQPQNNPILIQTGKNLKKGT